MIDETEFAEGLQRPSRLPMLLVGLLTSVWLVAAGILVAAEINPGLIASAGIDAAVVARLVGVVLAAAAPLAVLWLVAALLRDRSAARSAQTALLTRALALADHDLRRSEAAAAALEARIEAVFTRIEALAAPLLAQADAVDATAARLDNSGSKLADVTARTLAAGARLAAATPAAIADGERLQALLMETDSSLARQLADHETLLAGLWSRVAELTTAANSAAAVADARLAALTVRAGEAQTALSGPINAIAEAADSAFARTTAAADATREGVHGQTSALLASVEQARVTFDHIGRESSVQIGRRIEALLAAGTQLTAQIDDQSNRYQSLVEQLERSFGILDAKLGNSVTTGNSALETITLRMTDARDAIFRLNEPISASDAALVAVESRVAALGAVTATALAAIGSQLPASLPQVERLTGSLADLHDAAAALAAPIADGGAAIDMARTSLDTAQMTLETAAVTLAAELARARDLLAEIETLTGSASLTASTQLIDVFARVRDVAGQTAGTMRETLANVVSEAEAALEKAGSTRAESAFAAPIKAQIAAIEDANNRAAISGQAATERVTQRLLALTKTIATVEARIDEADTHYDIRLRDDIAKRSGALLQSLQDGAIDIAKLLAIDLDDNSWARYLRGDKSLFARRAVRLIDSGTERAIARHFQHDPAFAEQATRYITEFEALIARVQPDREGKGLAVTLLSSDVGKLYVALAQATERLR